MHFKENLKKDKFYINFKKLALLESTNEIYTKDKIMDIASRFFLIQKSPNGNGYQTKVCRGINGLEKESKKDYTILEAVMYDAIYNRVVGEEKDKPEFINSLHKYIEDITAKEDNVEIIKRYIFSSMSSDKNLNKFIFSYLEKNKDNIPFEVE